MGRKYQRIFLKQGEKYYYFCNYRLSNSDGSLYLSFPRKDKDYKMISYHSSGLIHYKNLKARSICGEPIFEITKPFIFINYSVPKIALLDIYPDNSLLQTDNIIEVSINLNLRITFSIAIAPNEYQFGDINQWSLKFNGLFDLIMLFNQIQPKITSNLNKHFVYLAPLKGFLNHQKYPKSYSQILFHQKINNTQDLIIYPPNNEGIYKIYFAVPMRISPKVKIQFFNQKLSAILLENESRTNMTLSFKVKDNKNNFIKKPEKIVRVELDAEL